MGQQTGLPRQRLPSWCRNRTNSSDKASQTTGSLHSGSEELLLCDLNDDILLSIFEFCSVKDLRQINQVNHHFRNVLFIADEFWWHMCHREWKWLPQRVMDTTDSLGIPGGIVDRSDKRNNMLTLLSMAAKKGPPSIDKRALQPIIKNPFCWLRVTARDFKLSLREVPTDEGDAAVQYTGIVGQADRSFRSQHPLPHPTLLSQKQLKMIRKYNKRPFFLYKKQNRPIWVPFVSPFIAGHVPNVPQPVVNMTPRLISYYEVTILPPPQQDDVVNFSRRINSPVVGESIGIGLATDQFRWHKRMPGHDRYSYGYHGDDGGLFRGSPQLLRLYGPPFGVGDTIGCGLDYQRRAIFFTWHGVFLGFAFENLSVAELQEDFYPVIGVDSNSLVSCNFGCRKPFLFDLNSMVCKQQKIVRKTLQPAKRKW